MRRGFTVLVLTILAGVGEAREQVIRGTLLSATTQAISLRVGEKEVSVKVGPDCPFFIYGRRMLGMVVPVGGEVIVVARQEAGGALVATSVADLATEAKCEAELDEGTQATLLSADPKERTVVFRVKYGWTITGALEEKAPVLKAGKEASLADFKAGERVGISARTRRGKWVIEALADPVTHYLLFIRGGRAGIVKEVEAEKGLIVLAVDGSTYKIRPTERTWLIVGGKLAGVKAVKPGMRMLCTRPFRRGEISFVRALVEADSIPSLPPEILLLLEEEPGMGRGRPIVGRLESVKEGEAVITDILRGEVRLRLSERTRLFRGGGLAKVEDFKPGEEVVAVPSATRRGVIYCGLLCDLQSYEAVYERLRAEEAE